ncbi:MAG TPA: hypothetical protein VM328_06450 [Fimbriimonadaceae bacterium]|nr:hypothetical protein [Fimbriimonadaceae bacterium]
MAVTTRRTRQYPIRFPADVAEQVERRKQRSVSEYVVEAVREKLERDRDAEIVAGLACLADDAEANDIGDFEEAQAEVFGRGD